jgi:hypothetical protein
MSANECIMLVLDRKFTSGNDTPVTRSQISREEYEMIVAYVKELNEELDNAYEKIRYCEEEGVF